MTAHEFEWWLFQMSQICLLPKKLPALLEVGNLPLFALEDVDEQVVEFFSRLTKNRQKIC